MRRMFWLVLGAALGGGAIYGAFNYHVLKTADGFELVPKRSASLAETYVDIRQFSVADWTSRPTLSADVMAAEKAHLLGEGAGNTIESGLRKLIDDIRK